MLISVLPESFGFTNGVLPILALVLLTILLPWALAGWIGKSQVRLAVMMLMVAVAVILAGAAVLADLTAQEDATARAMPWDLIQRSVRLAIAWGPIWLLVWLVRAQGIERRKALAMGREGEG